MVLQSTCPFLLTPYVCFVSSSLSLSLSFVSCLLSWCLAFGVWCLLFGVWRLAFGVWCLVFGVWCLVFGVWCLVFGVWCLSLGISGRDMTVKDDESMAPDCRPSVLQTEEPVITYREKKLTCIIGVAVILWAMEDVTGLDSATVGLVAVLIAYMPKWGVIDFIEIKKLNYPVLIFIISVLALGQGLSLDPTISGTPSEVEGQPSDDVGVVGDIFRGWLRLVRPDIGEPDEV